MIDISPHRPATGLLPFYLILIVLLLVIRGNAEPPPDTKSPKLRVICVSSLTENQEVVLASHDDKGAWHEYATLKLNSPFISEWLPAAPGELHLAVRAPEGLVSKCNFTFPENSRHALLILLPEAATQTYRGDVINPAKLGFAKGSTLLVNYSRLTGVVMLGSRHTTANPGERLIVTPVPEKNGMFRMLVGYHNASKEVVACYDRYIPYEAEARDLLLLFPDPAMGLRVYSLAEFGPFE